MTIDEQQIERQNIEAGLPTIRPSLTEFEKEETDFFNKIKMIQSAITTSRGAQRGVFGDLPVLTPEAEFVVVGSAFLHRLEALKCWVGVPQNHPADHRQKRIQRERLIFAIFESKAVISQHKRKRELGIRKEDEFTTYRRDLVMKSSTIFLGQNRDL